MVSIAPANTIRIEISGDTTGYVTGAPPNDATGDLDATVDLPNPNWTPAFTRWGISDDPGLGTASINPSTGEWTYTVDPAEYAALDNGEIVFDVFEVTATAYAYNPGGNLMFDTQAQLVRIAIESVCFSLGTLVKTPNGQIPVQDLKVGDLVKTADHGAQPIRWIEGHTVSLWRMKKRPELYPVRISAGALGRGLPRRDLYVSQQHRIMVSGPAVFLLFAEPEVLATARALCGWPGIDVVEPDDAVKYFHILLDHHEILSAEGAPAESLFLGEETLYAISPEGLQELGQIFEDAWQHLPDGFGQAARRLLRDFEARLLEPA